MPIKKEDTYQVNENKIWFKKWWPDNVPKNVTFEEIPDRTHFSISDMESPDNPVVKLMLTFIQKAISEE